MNKIKYKKNHVQIKVKEKMTFKDIKKNNPSFSKKKEKKKNNPLTFIFLHFLGGKIPHKHRNLKIPTTPPYESFKYTRGNNTAILRRKRR